ncbi:hypothetical protein Tco_0598834 [Tanacetum coccineum]
MEKTVKDKAKSKSKSQQNSIRRLDYANTSYPVTQGTTKRDDVKSEYLYSASANEINEKKPKLKNLPQHLEYAYLHGDKSFPIIISSKLSEKEKISRLHVLEKRKGAIAWKMSDIKGISPSYCTHNILMENDYKLVIQPQRRLNPKVQDVVKNEIMKLLDSGLIYLISDSYWMEGVHRLPILPNTNRSRGSRKDYLHLSLWDFRLQNMPFRLCNAPATFQRCMTAIFHDMVEDFMEVFMDDFSVFGNSFDCCLANLDRILARYDETNLTVVYTDYVALKYLFSKEDAKPRLVRWVLLLQGFDIEIKDKKGAENLTADHLSRLENPDVRTFTEEEITDEFPDEHLMILKVELNNNEPTAYKTPTGCTSFRLVYRKAYHQHVETEHKAYWALKQCNMDLTAAANNHFMELNELMKLRDEAYENN